MVTLLSVLAADWDVSLLGIALFNVPTIIGYIGILTAVIVSQRGFKTFVAAVNALLTKKYYISAADKEKAIRLFKLIAKSLYLTAGLMFAMGILFILQDLSNPSTVGPSVAIAVTSFFYTMLINLTFIYPAVNILETRYNAEEKAVISEKQVIDKLLEMCYKQGISPEDIMGALEIQVKKK
jgi:flagellar motor component MotA